MCSMNRGTAPRDHAYSHSATSSPSLTPRSATALSLTRMPAVTAASTPASTRARSPRPVSAWNLPASSVSIEMLIADTPAAASGAASSPRRWPFDVITTCSIPGSAAIRCASSTMPLRTVGSPPVNRILRTPSRANTAISRSSSSNDSTADRGSNTS